MPAVRPGDEGFVRADLRFSHEYVTPMAAALWAEHVGPRARVRDPELGPALPRSSRAARARASAGGRARPPCSTSRATWRERQAAFAAEQGIRIHAESGGGSEGICHSLVLERYALPGQVVIGSDSHTPHAGAIGCLAFGVGTTAICHAWLTADARVRVPPSLLVRVTGRLREGVTAKDLMLALLADPGIRRGMAVGRLVEYAGSGIESLSIDERATLTNMAAELGAFIAIVRPDLAVARFLEERRGMARGAAERLVEGLELRSRRRIRGDARAGRRRQSRRWWRCPAIPATASRSTGSGPVRIDIAYAGSCTAGKREDMDMYARVFAEAAGRRPAGCAGGALLRAVREPGCGAVRRRARLPRSLPRRRRRSAGARVRGMHQCRPRRELRPGDGDGERDQPELPRTLRARTEHDLLLAVPGLQVALDGGDREQILHDLGGAAQLVDGLEEGDDPQGEAGRAVPGGKRPTCCASTSTSSRSLDLVGHRDDVGGAGVAAQALLDLADDAERLQRLAAWPTRAGQS